MVFQAKKIASFCTIIALCMTCVPASAFLPENDRAILQGVGLSFQNNGYYGLENTQSRLSSNGAKGYLEWKYLTDSGTVPPLERIVNFIRTYKDWPNTTILRNKLENSLMLESDYNTLYRYFNANEPITYGGRVQYAQLLLQNGQKGKAYEWVKKIWTTQIFSPHEQEKFWGNFGTLLTSSDHTARLQYLLGGQYITQAEQMRSFLSSTEIQELALRTTLIRLQAGAENAYYNAPAYLQNHTGVKRDLVHYYRKNNNESGAINLILSVPTPANEQEGEFWYPHRAVMARVAFKRGDKQAAYHITANHGLKSGANFVDSQWYAGWLALRFLNNPQQALTHFTAGRNASLMPISMARGDYWIGRAYEALGRTTEAKESFTKASGYFYTYYGQLAAHHLGITSLPIPAVPVASEETKNVYRQNDLVQAIYAASATGNNTDAQTMLMHIAKREKVFPEIYPLLINTAQELGLRNMGLKIAKAATVKNVFVTDGYPTGSYFDGRANYTEIPLLMALTRQESEFDQYARSPVGASGLMQLMPATAAAVSRQIGQSYSASRLTQDAYYNVALGSYYLEDLVQKFNGSYVKALAGYNAGPGRIPQWTASYGDPYEGTGDIIDWIETIPFGETRNYVQRIIETVPVYRAKLKNSNVLEVKIMEDIKRGMY